MVSVVSVSVNRITRMSFLLYIPAGNSDTHCSKIKLLLMALTRIGELSASALIWRKYIGLPAAPEILPIIHVEIGVMPMA